MEDNNRNLILATVLSFLVILVWYTVFAPEPVSDQPSGQPLAQQGIGDQPLAPAVPVGEAAPADLAGTDEPAEPLGRVAIRSEALEGSISLLGGRIDDLMLTRYKETLDEGSPEVRLLSPSSATADDRVDVNLTKPYYAVYGWTPGPGVSADLVPGPATVWTLETGETLAPGQPVTLAWDNGAGQIFRRTFALDDNYLFTVGQSLENSGSAAFSAVAEHNARSATRATSSAIVHPWPSWLTGWPSQPLWSASASRSPAASGRCRFISRLQSQPRGRLAEKFGGTKRGR